MKPGWSYNVTGDNVVSLRMPRSLLRNHNLKTDRILNAPFRAEPFNLDTYEYEKGGYYEAFKAAVDEKICAAKVSASLANALRKEGLVYNDDTVKVADIGCGPADSIQMYLRGARHEAGFDLHVTDYNHDYADKGGMAEKNLTQAKAAGNPKINSFNVKQGDAFDGALNATLGTDPNSFDLAFISHMFYHAPKSGGVDTMMSDVTNNLLKENGVGVLFHLENTPKSFQYFRSEYAAKPKDAKTDTGAVQVSNPPETIEAAAKAAGAPVYTAKFDNNFYFAPMREDYWEVLKHPEMYKQITDPNALANLRKLFFMPQRAANEFAKDTGPTGLAAFIDEARRVIAPDQKKFEREGGFLKLAETVQVIGSTKATPETKEKLERVVDAVRQELPGITKTSFAEWERNYGRGTGTPG